ncbi:MAG: DUF4321 domain-containing protein [Oscillospiraceae bacterium]|nr:DUF4321 domain-containing protein [Oscillospiraceae bacterium]
MSEFKKNLLFIVCLLGGIVTGALLANLCEGVPFLSWLSYYVSFGISADRPLVLDLGILQLTFGVNFGLYTAQIFTIALSILIYNHSRIR